jgi:hypothetical protein
VLSACFNQSGTELITVGDLYMKLWHFENNGDIKKNKAKDNDVFIMMGNYIPLSERFQTKKFVDICCNEADTANATSFYFSITSGGIVVKLSSEKGIENYMDIKVPRAFSIHAKQNLIFVACSDAMIRILRNPSLEYIT